MAVEFSAFQFAKNNFDSNRFNSRVRPTVDLNDEKWGREQIDVLTPALVRDFWSLQSANVLSSWKSRSSFLVMFCLMNNLVHVLLTIDYM